MNNAQKVKEMIDTAFPVGADYQRIAHNVADDKVGEDHLSVGLKHQGYDGAYDGSMHAFFYGDGSILVISTSGATASE